MESEEVIDTESDVCYPVLIIPKSCTTLETNCEASDNVYIKLNITSLDTQGKESTIYSGFCNVKIIDSYNVVQNVMKIDNNLSYSDNVLGEITLMDSNDLYDSNNQDEILIDPMNNPYVSNNYSATEVEEGYSVYEAHREHLNVRQHNLYTRKNVFDTIRYSPHTKLEHKKFGQVKMNDEINQQPVDLSLDEELECGMILSQLPEEIMLAGESKAREEMKYVNLVSDNDAIQQLMSAELQSRPKQQRTILFIGDSSREGRTVQKIAVNDPQVECTEVAGEIDLVDENPSQKKYQCDKCQQMFCQLAAFRQHIQIKHDPDEWTEASNTRRASGWPVASKVDFICSECGKQFKTRERFEIHCLGHGNPELECQKCHKVFATKITLKNHSKLHLRKQKCLFCRKAYQKSKELREHLRKMHYIHQCDRCSFSSSKREDLVEHERGHGSEVCATESEATVSLDGWQEAATAEDVPMTYERTPAPDGQDPDSVIAKVISSEMFLLHSKKANKMKKICNICHKNFSRASDLKRHLIEHIIRSTLAKNPVDDSGTLFMRCEVCQAKTFRRIDRYKAHLREHAKLTIYQCTFCDKSFSDSSNFSKHKKIHSTTYFQCDLCHRKFHIKKTLIKHLQYHIKMEPLHCNECDKEFFFPSLLKKHEKLAHSRDTPWPKCKFCDEHFKSLKVKWDHEWSVHNVRKMIVDCLICGSKFRKYSQLKQHCRTSHEIAIPPIKKILKKRRERK